MAWHGEELLVRLRAAANRGLVRGAESIREEAIRLMDESPRGGRIYKRGGVVHTASAPGEPPAPDTGTLKSRVDTKYNFTILTAYIGVWGLIYSAYLEFGTKKMEPRPYMRPALENKRKEVLDGIKEEVANELS